MQTENIWRVMCDEWFNAKPRRDCEKVSAACAKKHPQFCTFLPHQCTFIVEDAVFT